MLPTKEKDFRSHAYSFLQRSNPTHRVVEVIELCFDCEGDKTHLYDFGIKKMCRACLIQDMMVHIDHQDYDTDKELIEFYFNEGVELEEAKKMVETAWNDITERNLALRQKPINHLQNKAA